MVEDREWLIKKDGYFYRPNFCGYATSKFEAGRYTKTDADREAAVEPWHMKAIHQDDVEDDPVSSRVRMDADRIEAFERELAEARKQSDRFCDKYLAALKRAEAAEADNARLREALERLLNPAPGVKKLPPWVYGVAKPALAGKE